MILSPEALQAFAAHAVAQYPREACGVVAGAAYVPCDNVAADPIRDFAITAQQMALIELERGPIEAVLHTHTYNAQRPREHPEWPSHMDMDCWLKASTPWGIAATDGEGISQLVWLEDAKPAPYEGREFLWGVHDCYSLIRDWFKQERGITLNNYAREWGHWNKGKSMYDDLFAKEGFVEITAKEAKVGDCVLMRYATRVTSHAAVITGTDQILHHLYHKQSGYDTLQKWAYMVTKFVRYEGVKP